LKPILVDTSVWRRYFAGGPAVRALGGLLDEDGAVLVHPFVIGEMVLGGLSAREEGLFARLPAAALVPHDEVLAFVRRRRLARRGIGWVDAHLLASALASGGTLWTVDGNLAAAAADLDVVSADPARRHRFR
jgi:predicted nucleic acid-binding protein